MERIVHRVTRMIACNLGGRAILLTEEDFGRLATRLMADLADLDIASFKMAAAKDIGILAARQRYREWERLFSQRLLQEIEEGRFQPVYDFREALAGRYVEDFLEAYRYSYLLINYVVGDLHDGSDQIINITLKGRRTFLDRVLNRYGQAFQEINVLKSHIRRIVGSSLDFVIEAGFTNYRFSPEGVRQM